MQFDNFLLTDIFYYKKNTKIINIKEKVKLILGFEMLK